MDMRIVRSKVAQHVCGIYDDLTRTTRGCLGYLRKLKENQASLFVTFIEDRQDLHLAKVSTENHPEIVSVFFFFFFKVSTENQ